MATESIRERVGTVCRTAGRRLYMSASAERRVVDRFARHYVESDLSTSWMGVPTQTPPTDLWNYQEIVHDTRPDLVVARATPNAGYLATLCRLTGTGEVVPWDGDDDADEQGQLDAVTDLARGKAGVMVVLGSGDRHAHLPSQLRRLGELVTPGNYLIVEDTTVDVAQAIDAFLREVPAFVVDRRPEKFYLTFNAGGYLRRTV